MITEDYVSFETAKLLKEKGFDEESWCVYNLVSEKFAREIVDQNFRYNHGLPNYVASAPTLQMAMKWLREVHNMHIEVKYFFEPHIYKYTITYTPVALDNISSHPQCFNTYEEACEAAIKYCLENLI